MGTFDTDLPIIVRARDMRMEAYVEGMTEALDLVVVHTIETGPESPENDALIRKARGYAIDLEKRS